MNLLWLFGVAFGSLMVIKAEWFLRTFGRIAWAEKNLGTEGGSRLFYKLLGIVAIIISFMGFTGFLGGAIFSVFGRFFTGLQ